jgi:abortive infection bacteriophage resistance protein
MRTFNKPPLTVPQQIVLLKQRGLTILDEIRAERFLEVATLFRLSPYMRPFQNSADSEHTFLPGASLSQIIDVYNFDRELRNLAMDAVERFEVAVRAAINNHMSCSTDKAHWYLDSSWFSSRYDHARLLAELQSKLDGERHKYSRESQRITESHVDEDLKDQRIEQRRRDNYFRYYGDTYDEPVLPPSWAMLEELSLGSLSRLYAGIAKDRDRKQIAHRFSLPQEVLGSWLHTLTFVRNCCAHHARLWNRELSVRPKLPRSGQWEMPLSQSDHPSPDRRLYVVLMMLAHLMLHVSPDSLWVSRLQDLLDRYPQLSRVAMGFPEGWQNTNFWQQAFKAVEDAK